MLRNFRGLTQEGTQNTGIYQRFQTTRGKDMVLTEIGLKVSLFLTVYITFVRWYVAERRFFHSWKKCWQKFDTATFPLSFSHMCWLCFYNVEDPVVRSFLCLEHRLESICDIRLRIEIVLSDVSVQIYKILYPETLKPAISCSGSSFHHPRSLPMEVL